MRYGLLIGLFLLTEFLFGQEVNPVLVELRLDNGEVFWGSDLRSTDSIYQVSEFNLGEISVSKRQVKYVNQFLERQLVRLDLTDGTVYQGHLVRSDESVIVLNTKLAGEVGFDRRMVMEVVSIIDRQTIPNPNRTRYFFAPSAIPLRKGEGYYQNAYLLANSANFGLTNNFALGGGIILPVFFYVTPKYSFKLAERWHAAVGAIAGTSILPGAFIAGALPFAVVTYGSAENNITLGSGYGEIYSDGEFETVDYPIGVLNGMVRLSSRLSLVSENWIIPVLNRETRYTEQLDGFGNVIYVPNNYEEHTAVVAASAGLRILVGDLPGIGISGNNPPCGNNIDTSIVYLFDGENSCGNILMTTNKYSNNQFQLVVISRQDTSYRITLDGNSIFDDTTLNFFNIDSIQVGKRGNGYGFTGIVDDVGIWNRYLSGEEIEGLYNETPTGMFSQKLNRMLNIYPNPTKDFLQIDCGDISSMNGYSIKIINSLGQTVFDDPVTQSSFNIDMNGWSVNGLYFLPY